MDDNERDALLARLDERSEAIHANFTDLKTYIIAVDKKVNQTEKEISWIKGVGATFAALSSLIFGAIEWFKR